MLKQVICLYFILTFPLFAKTQEIYVGPGTEFKFDSKNIKSLIFKPCEENSTCAEVEKEDDPSTKKKCTFKVIGENEVLELKIEGTRILTVKEVVRNDDGIITSLILEGAKSPIHFSCESRTKQFGSISSFPNFPLTLNTVKGFKEFGFGKEHFEGRRQKVPSQRLEGEREKSDGKPRKSI